MTKIKYLLKFTSNRFDHQGVFLTSLPIIQIGRLKRKEGKNARSERKPEASGKKKEQEGASALRQQPEQQPEKGGFPGLKPGAAVEIQPSTPPQPLFFC
ncbi:MAG: hypothetical protein V1936_00950 [Patescibacteria group bacterium]